MRLTHRVALVWKIISLFAFPTRNSRKGPVEKKVAIIDYDASKGCYYEGVDLDATAVLGQKG